MEIGETGIEDLLWKFRDEDIRYVPLAITALAPSIADHRDLLKRFEAELDKAVNSDAATIVIDSASRLWRSIRIVRTEDAHLDSQRRSKNQADYELANDYFEQLVQRVRTARHLNLVLVHRHREKYRVLPDGSGRDTLQPTGEMEARDYSGIENLVQVIVRCDLGKKFDPKTKTDITIPMHVIETCRFDLSLNGVVVPNMDYGVLVEKIYGRVLNG